MRAPAFSFSAALLGLLAAATLSATACAPSSDEVSASAEHATTSTEEDLALARDIVEMLGGEEGVCADCHDITPARLRAWGNTMKSVDDACFARPDLTPMERVDCLRSGGSPSGSFSARRLGLYAAGAGLSQFRDLFEAAFPEDAWEDAYASFTQRASMPRGADPPFTEEEFAKLKDWVLRGMPQLDAAFAADTPPAPTTCTPSTTPELAAHLAKMKTSGWGARLADEATPMFGCGAATNPLDCLAQHPDVTQELGAEGVHQKLRRLYQQPLSSHYWVRSSADGRWVGYGLNWSSKIVDLSKPETEIHVAADYDPYFLPSNDGFAFAGSHTGNAIHVCRQSLLDDAARQAKPSISLTEPKCARLDSQVYQSIGSALEGGRYFVTWGTHENDDGGHMVRGPLPTRFKANAKTVFTPMVSDGQSYRAQSPVTIPLPFEGDMMLSPSSLLAATRFGDGTKMLGYRIRFVNAEQQPDGNGSTRLNVTTPLATEVCIPGAKASFSFDERFVVTHQYVDRDEPDHAGLPERSSNIVIVDLATGQHQRITSMKRNAFALYPHFRADGWLYFVVRDMDADEEYLIASDVALRMANP